MRLTCPNCGAQYEVPDDVIPLDGRDVQCSACGHTWFQEPQNLSDELFETGAMQAGESHPQISDHPTSEEAAETPESSEDWDHGTDDDAPVPETDETSSSGQLQSVAPEPAAAGARAPEQIVVRPEEQDEATEYDDEEQAEEDTSPAPVGTARPTIDTSISDILREEAERETRLRAKETASGLESQPDLGLENYDYSDTPAPEPRDRRRGRPVDQFEDEDADNAPLPSSSSRRDLLPDIEEINSTLRTGGAAARTTGADTPVQDADVPRGSSFMRGFAAALVLGALLLLAYANAPRIARAVPQADPALSAYVAMVDQARYWIDAKLGGQPSE